MNIILILAILIAFGYVFGLLAMKIKLPSVSGYLIGGLVVGILATYLPKFFPVDIIGNTKIFDTISEITLSFIAFGIGSEFLLSDLKKSGKKVLIITIFEVVGAIAVVGLAMYFLAPLAKIAPEHRFAFALILGTMSAATAPAATILVIRQFRTKGPLTDTILPVAALDDVLGILAFGIALPIARMFSASPGNELEFTLWNIFKMPIVEVFGSLLVGLLLGFLLSLVSKENEPKDTLQVKSIFFVLLGLGVSNWLDLSPLLVNIMVGATLINLREQAHRNFRVVNEFVPVFYILFFTIAGATLNLNILTTVGIIGIVYVIARATGKIVGAFSGGLVAKAEPQVTKYIGFALLPQGGISIGLTILVMKYLHMDIARPIETIILFSILIYESSGPIFAKIALSKADELYKLDLEPISDDEDEY